MKLTNIITGIALVFTGLVSAQQIPQFSQYYRNQFQVNPAAAGTYDFVDVTFANRFQWTGFGSNPRTNYMSLTTLVGKDKPKYNPSYRVSQGAVRNPEVGTGKLKHAIGAQFYADQYGAFREMQSSVTYAIHLPVMKGYNLSFGTRLGMGNNSFLKDNAVVLNPNDPSSNYTGGDNSYDAYASQTGRYIMNLDAGLYFYSNKTFLGVSATNLTKDMISFGSSSVNFGKQIHISATAGHKFTVSPDLTVMPAILVKYMSPAPMVLEGNLQVEYKDRFWAAVGYRNQDAVTAAVGMNVSNRFKLGYSYDHSLSQFQGITKGGHEFVLGVMIGR